MDLVRPSTMHKCTWPDGSALQYNEREVTPSAIQNMVSKWNLPFYETSAKKNWHVKDVFEDLTRQMRKRYPNEMPRKKKKDCLIM